MQTSDGKAEGGGVVGSRNEGVEEKGGTFTNVNSIHNLKKKEGS